MDNTYLTTFKGEIDISAMIDKMAWKIRLTKVASRLGDAVSLDEDSDMFYLTGEIDDSEEFVEKLISAMYPNMVITDDIVIQAQGQDPKDRWDLIMRPDGVYVQYYDLVPGELRQYK
jgi:hypothetical protein